MARKICEEGLSLIKSFEGLELEAYPDPGTGGEPWTIGYGHTGNIAWGTKISEAQAEAFLQSDLRKFEEGVDRLIPDLNLHEFCALVSWAFNVGLGAVESSTLRRRILAGEDPQKVIPEELPRWINGASGPLPGLIARRNAEVEHAQKPSLVASEASDPPSVINDTTSPEEAPSTASEVSLRDFFKFYSSEYHQERAVDILQEALHGTGVLSPNHEWVKTFRGGGSAQTPKGELVQLNVPYLYQLDSEEEGQAGRMCFSSTNAMLVEYLKPGALKDSGQADDAYLEQVLEYGDTTSAEAQIMALASYEVNARFRQDGTTERAKAILRGGTPVPIGVLHHGSVSSPSGGGHWLLLVGFDEDAKEWICHDPAGRMDLLGGSYADSSPTAGRYVRYAFSGLNPRWCVAGEGDGWFVEVKR